MQALETIGKLKEINGSVRLILYKLQGIRADLVMTDDDWQEWKVPQLIEALESWIRRNSKPLNHKILYADNRTNPYRNPNKVYQANQYQIECMYCKKSEHKSADCQTVKTNSERRKLLSEKNLFPLH